MLKNTNSNFPTYSICLVNLIGEVQSANFPYLNLSLVLSVVSWQNESDIFKKLFVCFKVVRTKSLCTFELFVINPRSKFNSNQKP